MIRERRSAHPVLVAVCAVSIIGCLVNEHVLAANVATARKVGAVTWHASQYVGQTVKLVGYLVAREPGYVLFSDEPTGKISTHDLPVSGVGVDTFQPMRKYIIEGILLDHGLQARNGNHYHLELAAPPVQANSN